MSTSVGSNIIIKPEISHFTDDAIIFIDGTSASDVDTILLGTGYELRLPFLAQGHAVRVDPEAQSNETYTQGLVTNLRYVFPLDKHIMSLCPHYPTNALAFIGLPIYVSNCPSDIAQSLYAVHSIVNSSLLPPRNELLRQLAAEEDRLRSLGYDPYHVGHRILPVNGSAWDYQDELVGFLKREGAIPNDGKPFVEEWRRQDITYLKRGWERVKELGIQDEWLRGVKTEAEWANLMKRLNKWQAEWERLTLHTIS